MKVRRPYSAPLLPTTTFALLTLGSTAVLGQASSPAPSLPAITDSVAWILHAEPIRPGISGLFLLHPESGETIRIAADVPDGNHKHPDWSPDGQHVVFVVQQTERMWIAHLDGSPSTPITSCDTGGCDYPAWSPDGTRIAFSHYEITPGVEGPPSALSIDLLDLASGEVSRVVRLERPLLVDVPRWSPDGTQLVVGVDRFDDEGYETGATIAIVPATGGDPRYLTDFERFAYYPDWNRVTDQIVFSTEVIGFQQSPGPEADTWDLHLVQPDGTELRQLTHVADGKRLWNPTWTPDGTRITAAFEDASQGVWVDPTDGAIEPFPTTQLMWRPRQRPVP
jgi:Tol biopolymer transport system component